MLELPRGPTECNITTLGPREVAVAPVAEGAGRLVIICMYLPSNCHGVAGSCVGATAMGIKEGVCQGVFVGAHEGICSLQTASEATSERLSRAVREAGRSEVVDLSPSVENRSGL